MKYHMGPSIRPRLAKIRSDKPEGLKFAMEYHALKFMNDQIALSSSLSCKKIILEDPVQYHEMEMGHYVLLLTFVLKVRVHFQIKTCLFHIIF